MWGKQNYHLNEYPDMTKICEEVMLLRKVLGRIFDSSHGKQCSFDDTVEHIVILKRRFKGIFGLF